MRAAVLVLPLQVMKFPSRGLSRAPARPASPRTMQSVARYCTLVR